VEGVEKELRRRREKGKGERKRREGRVGE